MLVRGVTGVPRRIASDAVVDEAQEVERLGAATETPEQPAILDPLTGLLHDGGDVIAAFRPTDTGAGGTGSPEVVDGAGAVSATGADPGAPGQPVGEANRPPS